MKPKRPNFRPKINNGRGSVTRSNKKPINKDLYGENWTEISDYVRKRDNYTCSIGKITTKRKCGIRLAPPFHNLLHVHHIVPLPKGSNHPSNLVSLCVECHGWIHAKYLGKISDKQRRAVRAY